MRQSHPVVSRLHAIVDVDVAAGRGHDAPALARAFLDGGARCIQVRAKALASRPFLALCDEVVRLARPYDALVIVNDRVDLARLSGAGGVHLGQEDLPVAAARRLLGEAAVIGLSTHSVEQIEAARAEPATYVAVGPVFGTRTKDTGYTAVGLSLVREAARRSDGRPVVAIGGITLENAASVIDAGASAVAVIGDLLAGPPEERVRAFLRTLSQGSQER
jgi:thiamine-phosphate pyrophosphorylase